MLASELGSGGSLRAAHGYACASEPLHIYPDAAVIPTNAELRIVLPHGAAELYVLGENRQVLRRGVLTAQNPRFSLKSAQGAPIALRATPLPGPILTTLILQLPQPLQPDTVYELQAQDASTGSDFPLTKYKTSAGPDSTPPILQAPTTLKPERRSKLGPQLVQGIRYYHLSQAGYKQASGPWLELTVSANDDQGPVYYEILRDGSAATLPLAVGQPDSNGTLRLGRWNICRASELEFPARGPLPLLVRAVDGAGNKSDLASFTVDVSPPLRRR